MKPNILIDLYIPAHLGSLEEIGRAAEAQGLDAVVLVGEDPEELPDADELAEFNAESRVHVHTAAVIAGPGYRAALFVDGRLEDVNLDAIEASGDFALIQAALDELDGCALPICPRQGAEGVVHRQVVPLPPRTPVGVVALVAASNRLGRDLDIEDAGADGRRILGATGPFGRMEDVGLYATLLPAAADDLGGIIDALTHGHGVGVELGVRPDEPPRAQQRPDKKKRRRRSRKKRPNDGGGAEPSSAS
ncbi:MAG: hypothetical protein EP329_10615 [Deltaproteobacteria bacterium]|nr:MAG: hypothetical protein EP329_10615 [Deltaproteobacteria bacterium]